MVGCIDSNMWIGGPFDGTDVVNMLQGFVCLAPAQKFFTADRLKIDL